MEQNTPLKIGHHMMTSLPGITQVFQAEIIELQPQDGYRTRVCVRALEPVLAHDGTGPLYQQGAHVWLMITLVDGKLVEEISDQPDPPQIGYLNDPGAAPSPAQ